ncbi:CD59 glycoprotein [Photinus pyralis]|uniref:Protein sleepless n=1 Tax=Photinus pyralis TaxID=7054 RepID=A0A1Y1N7F6_PHOPY|nr:CD59 glycoprotein [Photinus pyralis]
MANLLLLVLLVRGGQALLCYECTEATNPDCRHRIANVQSVMCRQPSDVCVVHRTPPAVLNVEEYGANMTMKVIRGCKFKDYCQYVREFSARCTTCTTDLCNFAASSPTPTALVPICISAFLFIIV